MERMYCQRGDERYPSIFEYCGGTLVMARRRMLGQPSHAYVGRAPGVTPPPNDRAPAQGVITCLLAAVQAAPRAGASCNLVRMPMEQYTQQPMLAVLGAAASGLCLGGFALHSGWRKRIAKPFRGDSLAQAVPVPAWLEAYWRVQRVRRFALPAHAQRFAVCQQGALRPTFADHERRDVPHALAGQVLRPPYRDGSTSLTCPMPVRGWQQAA